jgi:hypothetical protein
VEAIAMKHHILLLSIVMAIAATGGFALPVQIASADDVSFYVTWYDVGKAALEGRPGVEKVTSGWHRLKEINTVTYDPDLISVSDMIAILKRAGTFSGVVQ